MTDLVGSTDLPAGLQDNSSRSAELMTELIRNREINLTSDAKKLTLEECISLALQSNPNITKQFSLYQGLTWDSISTRREWLPALTLDAPLGYRNKTTETYSFNPNSLSTSRGFQLQNGSNLKPELKFSWSLLNLSRISLLQAQTEEARSQGLRLRKDVRELILDVQSDYYDLQRARQEEDIYNGIYELSQKLLSKTSSRALSQESEEILAALKARSLQALSQRISAQQNVVRLSASLSSRLALPPGSFILPAETLAIEGRWAQRLNDTIAIALDRREEIKIANSQSKASTDRAKSLVRKYIPEIAAEATGKLENDNFRLGTNTSPNIPTQNTFTFDKIIGLRIKWTIFDSGVLAAQSSSLRKKALASQKQADLDRLTIEAQIKTAYSVLTSQLIQLPVLKREIAQSMLSLESRAKEANSSSAASVTNLIQALDQYQSAASRWLETLLTYNKSIAKLYRYSSQWPAGVASQISSKLNYLEEINMETHFQPK